MAKTGFQRKIIKNISSSKKGNVKNSDKSIWCTETLCIGDVDTARRYSSFCPVDFLLFVDLIRNILYSLKNVIFFLSNKNNFLFDANLDANNSKYLLISYDILVIDLSVL